MVLMNDKRYYEKKKRLAELKLEKEDAIKQLQEARSYGDLRENNAYDCARENLENITREERRLEEELQEAEIVPDDRGPRITIGSVIDVTKVDADGTPRGETRRFTVESSGDTIVKKVIGVKSPLGMAILNGTDAIYKVPTMHGAMFYQVKKVIGSEA